MINRAQGSINIRSVYILRERTGSGLPGYCKTIPHRGVKECLPPFVIALSAQFPVTPLSGKLKYYTLWKDGYFTALDQHCDTHLENATYHSMQKCSRVTAI